MSSDAPTAPPPAPKGGEWWKSALSNSAMAAVVYVLVTTTLPGMVRWEREACREEAREQRQADAANTDKIVTELRALRSALPPAPAAVRAALADGPEAQPGVPRADAPPPAIRDALAGVVAVESLAPGTRQPTVGAAAVVSPDGWAVTCNHVAGAGATLTAVTHDGVRLPAELVRRLPGADLALIRVRSEGPLPCLKWCAAPPAVGDTVWAAGSPFGLRHSLSRGVLSAAGRDVALPSGVTLKGLFQTDAAANPGNSGGPLLNDAGEVVGLVSATREGAEGVAFAVPSWQARPFFAAE